MKRSIASKLLEGALYLILGLGLFAVVTLPFNLDYYMITLYDVHQIQPGYRSFILCFLIVVGILGMWIVAELIRMLRTISADPFVSRNVRAFKRIGYVAFVTSVLFLAKSVLYFTILTFLCGVFLLICSLFAFTLRSLFRQAVVFKEENDLTI